MQTPDNVIALARAAELRDGMITVARSLADRDCGAMQSEMREAQIDWLAEQLCAPVVDAVEGIVDLIEEKLCIIWNEAGRDEFKSLLSATLRTFAHIPTKGTDSE